MGYAQRAARAWAGLATAVAGLSAVAVFGFAGAASADVSFDTEQAQRTGGARVAFKLTNDSPTASVTKFEVRFPGEYNIAEIYPIAVGEWAPLIKMKPVDDNPDNDVPIAVEWTAMPGKEIKPGATSLLPLAMGPMPDADYLYLDVTVTRSDGSTETWAGVDAPTAGAQHPAFAVKLVPLKPGEVPEVGHGGAEDTGVAQTQPAAEQAAQDPDNAGSSNTVTLAVALLLIAALTGFALYWQRRRGAASASTKLAKVTADEAAPAARVPAAQRTKGAPPKKASAAKKAGAATKAPAAAKATATAAKTAPKAGPAEVEEVAEPVRVQRRSVVRSTAGKRAVDRRRTVTRKSAGGAATATIARRGGNASDRVGDTDRDNA